MAAEYSYPIVQAVPQDGNIAFLDGNRACTKGNISHRANSGVFRLKGGSNGCKAIYRLTFNSNVAITAGSTVAPITVALQEDGETITNAVATVTPTVAEAFFNVSINTFVSIPCGCCVTVSIKNIGTTAINAINSNLMFERIA